MAGKSKEKRKYCRFFNRRKDRLPTDKVNFEIVLTKELTKVSKTRNPRTTHTS